MYAWTASADLAKVVWEKMISLVSLFFLGGGERWLTFLIGVCAFAQEEFD